MQEASIQTAVCFTCGNAADWLRNMGVDVISIGHGQDLEPKGWWKPCRIQKTWPHAFDATSGHLPLPLMLDIAKTLNSVLGDLREGEYEVPTGSGETVFCLRLAYPRIKFVPVFGVGKGTERDDNNPLLKYIT